MPFGFDIESLTTYTLVGTALLGGFAAALWLSLVIWTYRDMRSRSRDVLAHILAALVVALLSLPGFVVYLILRPPETLAEAYQRSLEEEALLQGIEGQIYLPWLQPRYPARLDAVPQLPHPPAPAVRQVRPRA